MLLLLGVAADRANRAGQSAQQVAIARQLIAQAAELVPHPARYSRDARAIVELRQNIGNCLEKLYNER